MMMMTMMMWMTTALPATATTMMMVQATTFEMLMAVTMVTALRRKRRLTAPAAVVCWDGRRLMSPRLSALLELRAQLPSRPMAPVVAPASARAAACGRRQ